MKGSPGRGQQEEVICMMGSSAGKVVRKGPPGDRITGLVVI